MGVDVIRLQRDRPPVTGSNLTYKQAPRAALKVAEPRTLFEPEPEGWLRSVVGSAGPVGTFALLAVEHGGAAPIRIEEVLICQLVSVSDV